MARPRSSARLTLAALGAWFLGGCSDQIQMAPGEEGLLRAQMFTGPRPGDLAQMAMDPYDANARYIGTQGLANAFFASEAPYIALFEDNIDDPEPAVRAAAVRGLANHGAPEHAALLIEALGDDDRLVRLEAARGLQRLHNAAAVDPLISIMREPDVMAEIQLAMDAASRGESPPDGRTLGEPEADVRAEAAHALGQYAAPRVVDALIAALGDRSLAVNRNALASLRTLTGQDFGLDRAAWLEWAGASADLFAARAVYEYPVFHRSRKFIEYLPFVPPPPNEAPGPPAGLPREAAGS